MCAHTVNQDTSYTVHVSVLPSLLCRNAAAGVCLSPWYVLPRLLWAACATASLAGELKLLLCIYEPIHFLLKLSVSCDIVQAVSVTRFGISTCSYFNHTMIFTLREVGQSVSLSSSLLN